MNEFLELAWKHLAEQGKVDKQFCRVTDDLWRRFSPEEIKNQHPELLCAIFYRSLGWSVIPISKGEKRPLVKWKEFQDRLPSFPEIMGWFLHPRWQDPGIGLVLGPISGVFAIDVDGTEAHQVLQERSTVQPFVVRSISGSRKPHRYHLLYSHPPIETNAKFTPWHKQLEFRGNKGLVVLPPSLHQSGHRYIWDCEPELLTKPFQPLPLEILKALSDRRNFTKPPVPVQQDWNEDDLSLDDLLLLPCLTQNTQYFLYGMYAYGSGWNTRLFNAACDLCGCGIPFSNAADALLEAAKPVSSTDREIALRTIESAYGEPRLPGKTYCKNRQEIDL